MNLKTKYNGLDVNFFEIKAHNLTFTFSSLGASIYSLYLNDNMPLVLELKDVDLFLKSPQYFNKTLGLVAGRLATKFNAKNNEVTLKETSTGFLLHGGEYNSLSFKVWDYEVIDEENKDFIDVIFKTYFEGNDTGLIGKGMVYNTYRLYKNEDKFNIIQKVDVEKDMVINLSNHIYWNLNRTKTIDEYYLKFDAPKIGDCYDNLLLKEVIDAPKYLSFKEGSTLKYNLDEASKTKIGTIDNTFIFNELDDIHEVILESKDIKVTLTTSYPAMNIYADSSLTDVEFNNYPSLKERRGIALEPQLNLLNKDSLYFKKNEKYERFITYKIELKK